MLLHYTGSSACCSVLTSKGWDGVGVGGDVYIWPIPVVVQQKLSQHCKAIILQLKKKKKNWTDFLFNYHSNRLHRAPPPPETSVSSSVVWAHWSLTLMSDMRSKGLRCLPPNKSSMKSSFIWLFLPIFENGLTRMDPLSGLYNLHTFNIQKWTCKPSSHFFFLVRNSIFPTLDYYIFPLSTWS